MCIFKPADLMHVRAGVHNRAVQHLKVESKQTPFHTFPPERTGREAYSATRDCRAGRSPCRTAQVNGTPVRGLFRQISPDVDDGGSVSGAQSEHCHSYQTRQSGTSDDGKALPIMTGGRPDAQLGRRLCGNETRKATGSFRPKPGTELPRLTAVNQSVVGAVAADTRAQPAAA